MNPDNASWPKWHSQNGGSFVDGDNRGTGLDAGTTVWWQAPDVETENIKVYIEEDDKPTPLNPGDTGSRNDSPVTMPEADWITGIRAVLPEPDEVTFVSESNENNHTIYDVPKPEWTRTSAPLWDIPVSYTMNTKARIKTKFWASHNLTKSETVDIEAFDNFYDYTQCTGFAFGTSWPSSQATNTTIWIPL